jgi:hypothetical protein
MTMIVGMIVPATAIIRVVMFMVVLVTHWHS